MSWLGVEHANDDPVYVRIFMSLGLGVWTPVVRMRLKSILGGEKVLPIAPTDTMAAVVLATQGARASAGMVLVYLLQYNRFWQQNGLTNFI